MAETGALPLSLSRQDEQTAKTCHKSAHSILVFSKNSSTNGPKRLRFRFNGGWAVEAAVEDEAGDEGVGGAAKAAVADEAEDDGGGGAATAAAIRVGGHDVLS